jgi:hypothetical protein
MQIRELRSTESTFRARVRLSHVIQSIPETFNHREKFFSHREMSLDDQLLEASSTLNFPLLQDLLAQDISAGYQDPSTGHGPLHKIVLGAAAAPEKLSLAQEMLEYVLANGGVWMQGMQSWEKGNGSRSTGGDAWVLGQTVGVGGVVRDD